MIKIDDRENDEFKSICELFLNDSKITRLNVGDIEINNIIFEHKTPADFISSVYDGRIFRQIEEMKNNYDHYYILISGSISEILESPGIKYNSIIAAISSCFVRNCPIIFCDSYENLCGVIKILSEKLNDGKNRTIPIIKIPIEDDQLRLICSISGISQKKGQLLLDRFRSPMGVFNAPKDELMEIKGIGDKITKHTQSVLNEKI